MSAIASFGTAAASIDIAVTMVIIARAIDVLVLFITNRLGT